MLSDLRHPIFYLFLFSLKILYYSKEYIDLSTVDFLLREFRIISHNLLVIKCSHIFVIDDITGVV